MRVSAFSEPGRISTSRLGEISESGCDGVAGHGFASGAKCKMHYQDSLLEPLMSVSTLSELGRTTNIKER